MLMLLKEKSKVGVSQKSRTKHAAYLPQLQDSQEISLPPQQQD